MLGLGLLVVVVRMVAADAALRVVVVHERGRTWQPTHGGREEHPPLPKKKAEARLGTAECEVGAGCLLVARVQVVAPALEQCSCLAGGGGRAGPSTAGP